MKIKKSIVSLLAVLVVLGSLVAIAAVPASAAGAIGLSAPEGTVGASVTINASTFPGTTVLSAKFDGVVMTTSPTTVTTDATGVVNFAVLIPTATAGVHQISVTDGVNTAIATFTIRPKVVVTSPTSKMGAVGTSVTVAGTGFSGAGVTADVTMGGLPVASGVVVDSNGSFTATGTVPSLTAGTQKVSAKDGAGNSANGPDNLPVGAWDNRADFTVTPTLAISPTSGLPGATVQLTGSGWLDTPDVVVTFAGGSAVNVDPSSTGVINASYTIPASATPGVKTVLGTQGTTTASTTFTVSPRVLVITPATGPCATKVMLTGSNMTKNGKILAGSLLFLSNPAVAWNASDISIDSAGTIFPTTLSVPTALAAGTYTVQATDNGGMIAYGQFIVTKPTIALNPTTGAINTSFTVTGAGWLPGTITGSTVTVTFSYTTTTLAPASVAVSTTPDGSGNIAAAITVPADAAAGYATVTAADSKSNAAASKTFTVPGALITVTPAQGAAGTSVTVTGSGFAAYTAVTVKIGTYKFLSQPLTDSVGAFTYTFTVPGLAAGSQPVSASDGDFTTGSTASAYFVISSAGASTASQTAGISSQLVRVWGYSGGTWSMYDPADASGSTLASLVSGNGYWFNVSAACTLIYGGYSYPLNAGWNLIGWR